MWTDVPTTWHRPSDPLGKADRTRYPVCCWSLCRFRLALRAVEGPGGLGVTDDLFLLRIPRDGPPRADGPVQRVRILTSQLFSTLSDAAGRNKMYVRGSVGFLSFVRGTEEEGWIDVRL